MKDDEHKTLNQIIQSIFQNGVRGCDVEIIQMSYGTFQIGEFRITAHNCPKCLRNKDFLFDLCQVCDWFIPRECPLLNNYRAIKEIRRQFTSIYNQEYKSWYEDHLIRGVARKFLSSSSRPRHYVVIAYEIKQKYPNLNVGNKKVLHALRSCPVVFVEVKTGEFDLI